MCRLIDTARRAFAAIEPWYDWGPFGWQRLDDRGCGDGHRFEVEFLGLKLLIVVGRTPPAQD